MAAADFGQASRARPSLSASAEQCQLQECGAGSRGEGHVNEGLNVVRSGDNAERTGRDRDLDGNLPTSSLPNGQLELT